MTPDISERAFEEAIERTLLQYGADAVATQSTAVQETPPPYGDNPSGGCRKRAREVIRSRFAAPVGRSV